MMNVVEYFVLMYENGNMRPVETVPGMGEGGKRRMMEKVNSTMIYCKNFYKCHNVPSIQLQYGNNKSPVFRCIPHPIS
jgi:hypothetical protein